MANSLKVLQRIKKMELDEQRRVLMNKLEAQDNCNKQLKNLIETYEAEKKFAEKNPLLGNFGAYTKSYLKKKRLLEQQIEALEKEIAAIRDVMSDMFKEQKTYSIIDELRQKAEQKELNAAEQKMLDEIGTNAYIKKHQTD